MAVNPAFNSVPLLLEPSLWDDNNITWKEISFLGIVAVIGLFATGAHAAHASHAQTPAGGKVTVINAARVYHPTILTKGPPYKSPAILKTATVFNAIPEWKTIKRKNLTDKDAEYHLLLKTANDKFNKAVSKVQKAKSYDIIAETGAIKCEKITPAEITTDVVNALPTGTN